MDKIYIVICALQIIASLNSYLLRNNVIPDNLKLSDYNKELLIKAYDVMTIIWVIFTILMAFK